MVLESTLLGTDWEKLKRSWIYLGMSDGKIGVY